MKNFIKILKPICAVLFWLAVTYLFYYKVCVDNQPGSLLNSGSNIIDDRYYLADNERNLIEIEKNEWDSLTIKVRIFKICVNYLVIYLIYIWYKFLIIPNMKEQETMHMTEFSKENENYNHKEGVFEFCKKNIIWITVFVAMLNLVFCFVNGFSAKHLGGFIIALLVAAFNCFLNYKIMHKEYVDNLTLLVLYGCLLISIIFLFYNMIPGNIKTKSTMSYIYFSPVFIVHFFVYKKLDIKKKYKSKHP